MSEGAPACRRVLLRAGAEERRQRQHEHREQHAGADERERLTVRRGRRVERVRQRRHRHRRRREQRERRDHSRPAGVELLRPVAQPADDERDPEHEHAVREDRADERRLDDVDEALAEREERDEELGQVAERGLDDARAARAEPGAELLGRGADEPGERGERDRGDDERHDVARAREVADRRDDDHGEGDRQLDPLAPVHRRETVTERPSDEGRARRGSPMPTTGVLVFLRQRRDSR